MRFKTQRAIRAGEEITAYYAEDYCESSPESRRSRSMSTVPVTHFLDLSMKSARTIANASVKRVKTTRQVAGPS